VWLKTVIPRQLPDFPQNAQHLQKALHSIVEILGANFPQLKTCLCLQSDLWRIFGNGPAPRTPCL
jgi:hypothetical protein